MRRFFAIMGLLILATCACSSKGTSPDDSQGSTRTYNGTASVGDFMTITIDAAAQTLAYTNHSNGDAGTVPYTVNVDGTYTLDDSTGNLLAAYEVPDYVLLIQAAKTGPNHDTMALVTAVRTSPISLAGMTGRSFNLMQFRTASGGLEVGAASIGAESIASSSYWPYGASSPYGAFNNGTFTTSDFQADPSGTYLILPGDESGQDYVFGTPNGIFAVDTPNGAILGLEKADGKDFDPANAGEYTAIYYQKVDAWSGPGNTESGTPSLGQATVAIDTAGVVTVTESQGSVMAAGALVPIEDTAYLYGPGLLEDPCHGLFTVRTTTGNLQQDFFIAFLDGAALFASFRTNPSPGMGGSYDYFYGVGLR